MAVRAKFVVQSKTEFSSGVAGQPISGVKLTAVYANSSPDSENSKFFKATPNATIEMTGIAPEVAAQFEIGAEVYVDFTPAELPPCRGAVTGSHQ